MKIFSLFLAIVLLACHCSLSQSIDEYGLARSYVLHVPDNLDKTNMVPLLIVLHGGGGNGKGMQKLSAFDDIADKNSFVVVYPDGVKKQWNDGRDDFHLNERINDVKFISDLIDTLKSQYNIDSNRVYVTGISNGGIMSFRLACELSNKIAAFAPVAASMPDKPSYTCSPLRPVPMMMVFGEDDPLVPFGGGEITLPIFQGKRGSVIPVMESVNYWLRNNKCNTVPVVTHKDTEDDDTELEKSIYTPANSQAEVQLWLVKGGGHCWPGGAQYLPKFLIGKSSSEFDASLEIWNFFKDKRKSSD